MGERQTGMEGFGLAAEAFERISKAIRRNEGGACCPDAQRMRSLSPETIDNIRDLRFEGCSVKQIMGRLGVSYGLVRRHLPNGPLQWQSISQVKRNDSIRRLYKTSEMTMREVGARFGITRQRVAQIIGGVNYRKRLSSPHRWRIRNAIRDVMEGKNLRESASRNGATTATLRRHLREAGITKRDIRAARRTYPYVTLERHARSRSQPSYRGRLSRVEAQRIAVRWINGEALSQIGRVLGLSLIQVRYRLSLLAMEQQHGVQLFREPL